MASDATSTPPTSTPSGASSGAASEPRWPATPVLIGAGIVLLALGLSYWDFFSRQIEFAVRQTSDWGHTLAIPLIAGWFVWARREDLGRTPFRTTWAGFIFILLGLAWYSLCIFGPQPLHHHNLRAGGVALGILGIVILFCGWQVTWKLAFPLIYLFIFGQTISDRFIFIITERLQDITAVGAEFLLSATSVDVEREGNTLFVYRNGVPTPLNIAEACSGMRMLMAFLALGTAMAWAGLSRTWQRFLVIALVIPTSIFVNILRVITLGYLSMVDAGLAAGDFHSFIGLVWLMPAFIILMGVIWAVKQLVIEPDDGAGTSGATA
ncbi:MAG: exosortase/archaeosortase family protein [Phycisphaerales bacterium]